MPFPIAVADLAADGQGLPEAVESIIEPLQFAVGNANAVHRPPLAIAVADAQVKRECLLEAGDSVVELPQFFVGVAKVV